jgi:hypothetical protein
MLQLRYRFEAGEAFAAVFPLGLARPARQKRLCKFSYEKAAGRIRSPTKKGKCR